jgi:hypothetical protein
MINQWLRDGIIISDVIMLIGLLLFFSLYMIIDIKGRHIVLQNGVLRQRFCYYKFVDINVATIRRCYIKVGVDPQERRGAVTARLQCSRGHMDINTYYYSMQSIRKLIKQIGLDDEAVPKLLKG